VYKYKVVRGGYTNCPRRTALRTRQKIKIALKSLNPEQAASTRRPRRQPLPPKKTCGHHLEQEESHRPQALKGVEKDTRRKRRDEAIGGRPSTEAAPRPILLLDPSSPLTTPPPREDRGRSSQPPSTAPAAQPASLKQKGRSNITCRAAKIQARTPVQQLPNSPVAPEWSTIGARRSWSIIPRDAAAFASSTPPWNASCKGTFPQLNLAPPTTTASEQTLDLTTLCTSARRFPRPPPSPTPPRPPEKEAGGTAAGNGGRSLFASLTVAEGRKGRELEGLVKKAYF